MYYTSKNTKWDENVKYDWLKAEGEAIDALRGYQCIGFFKDAADVESSAKVNANTKPGDLKYVDQNNDGVINEQDQVVLGKWGASWVMGLNLTAKYKGFTLFVAGTGSFGGKGLKNNSYMHVYAIANILKWFADAGRKRRQISPHTRVSQHKVAT